MDSRLKDETENKQAPLSQETPRRKTPSRLEAFLSAKARKISKAPRQLKKFLAQANKRRKASRFNEFLVKNRIVDSSTTKLRLAIEALNKSGERNEKSEIYTVIKEIEAKNARNAKKMKEYQTQVGKARAYRTLSKRAVKYEYLLQTAYKAINSWTPHKNKFELAIKELNESGNIDKASKIHTVIKEITAKRDRNAEKINEYPTELKEDNKYQELLRTNREYQVLLEEANDAIGFWTSHQKLQPTNAPEELPLTN